MANPFGAFFVFIVFWLGGLWGQHVYNANNSKDYSCPAPPVIAYFFGLRPRIQKIYLRMATIQLMGWVYFSLGFFVLWYPNERTLSNLLDAVIWLGVLFVSLIWMFLDIVQRSK